MSVLCSFRQSAENAAELNCIGRDWTRGWMK